jgi:FlaA1/EpsC-like NDP-sugar epimerase
MLIGSSPITDSDYRSDRSLVPVLLSVTDENAVNRIFEGYRPNTVFHAAAYKHVTLVEQNVSAALWNNIWGTYYTARAALASGTEIFVLVSSDKAVRPTSIMGASKRIAEQVMQGFSEGYECSGCKFCSVRFGNVLGSSGSVVPIFKEQISNGGPVTVTHRDVTRYFMAIPEAAQLILQASGMAKGGEVFVLDMGNPIRIYDLALRMIEFSGHSVRDRRNPKGTIELLITGLSPGEKLFEELLIGGSPERLTFAELSPEKVN